MQKNSELKQNINEAVTLLQELGRHDAANLETENIKEPECEYQKKVLNDAVERIKNGAKGCRKDLDIINVLVVHEGSSTLKRGREEQGNTSDGKKRANASTGTTMENDQALGNLTTNQNGKTKDESEGKLDPMKSLGGCNRIWAKIVSYCAEHGKQHDGIWIKDAVKIHTTLSLVSKSWMSAFKNPMHIGNINVNLNALQPKQVIPSIQWMCRHGSHLSSLDCRVRFDHIPIIEKLLQETNTGNLKNISMTCEKFGQPWIDHAYLIALGVDPGVLDLSKDDGPSFEERANALGMPFESDASNTELGIRLQENIAIHCPNLESLHWDGSNADDLHRITKFIQNLCNLQKLELASTCHGSTDKKILIYSKSLRHLDVSRFGRYNFVACKCPLLEKFVCLSKGGYISNGSMPILSQAEIEEYNKKHREVKHLVQSQRELKLPDMDIPNECECILRDFRPSLEAQERFIESGTPSA